MNSRKKKMTIEEQKYQEALWLQQGDPYDEYDDYSEEENPSL